MKKNTFENQRSQYKEELDKNDRKEKQSKMSKLNVLFILLTLKNYSSEEQPLPISSIVKQANETFAASGESLSLNRSTVERILDALMENENFGFELTDINHTNFDLHNLGFRLYCVVKGTGEQPWEPYTVDMEPEETLSDSPSATPKKQKGPVRYFYCESVFSDAELKTLIDAMEVYNYFSSENITTLINKLLRLRPQSALTKETYLPDSSLKDSTSEVLSNIEEFTKMIQEKKFAEIVYCTYSFSPKTGKLELAERPGYPCKIRPISMMWSNGNYYLVAMLDSKTGPKPTPANLRMDRICISNIIEPEPGEWEKFQPPGEISPSIYRLNHPVMFGGKPETITMLCRENPYNGMVNAIMDTFGPLAHCRLATQEELEQYLGYGTTYCPDKPEKWIHVRVYTTIGGVELFATQYCRNCRVIQPQKVADRVKRNLEVGSIFYSSQPPQEF